MEIQDKLEIAIKWHNVALELEKDGHNIDKETHPDNIFHFMVYWITFNYLYANLYYNNFGELNSQKNLENTDKPLEQVLDERYSENFLKKMGLKKEDCDFKYHCTHKCERGQILLYVDTIMDKLIENDFYKYCKNNGTAKGISLFEAPIRNINEEISEGEGRDNSRSKYLHRIINLNYETSKINTKKQIIMAIIMTIYQIRCNLFHGHKCPDNNRDRALVTIAGRIMNRLLEIACEK